jgi:hypothetical protein
MQNSKLNMLIQNIKIIANIGWKNLTHPIFTQVASSLQLIMVGFSNFWWFCGEVFYTQKITNSADNLKVDCEDHGNEN